MNPSCSKEISSGVITVWDSEVAKNALKKHITLSSNKIFDAIHKDRANFFHLNEPQEFKKTAAGRGLEFKRAMKEAAVSLKHYIYFIVQSFVVDHWLNQFDSDLFGVGQKKYS